jgi:hypothetical protein
LLRKLVIGVALAGLLSAAAASATIWSRNHAQQQEQQSVSTTPLMPGVTYTREIDFTSAGPVVLDIVTAPKPAGRLYTLAPALASGAISGLETLTQLQGRVDPDGASVAIDGDYFNRKSGRPSGIFLQGGVLENQPLPGRSSLGIAADGTLQLARVSFAGTWQGSGQRRVVQLNTAAKGHFTLYTPAYGARTPKETGVVEDVIAAFPPATIGDTLSGTVTQVTASGSTPIPSGGAVLVARGANVVHLEAEAPVGQQVDVRLLLSPDWSGLASAVGGGPVLVRNGKPVFAAGETFDPRVLNSSAARGAVGQLADGRIVFVTVEGTNPGYSIGMSSYELALELVRLGAKTAIGLGAGTPAGIAFDGALLTQPPDGQEARVSNALVLSYSGVYAAPPSTPVLSPNGDGVDDTQSLAYRLARPSQIVAQLHGPGGAAIELANETDQPGLHTLSWDGTLGGATAPEGGWTFTITATDDRGVRTTAQQTFSLDDTLGSLAVTPGPGGYATVTFDLTRSADVVVLIERPNGVSVKTLRKATLGAGSYAAIWKGRIGGRQAPGGNYQVEVLATSSVGTSSLVAPFSLTANAGQ